MVLYLMYYLHCWNGLVGAALAGHGWLHGGRSSGFFPQPVVVLMSCCDRLALFWLVHFFSVRVFCILLLCISNLTYFVIHIVLLLIVYTCIGPVDVKFLCFLTWTINKI